MLCSGRAEMAPLAYLPRSNASSGGTPVVDTGFASGQPSTRNRILANGWKLLKNAVDRTGNPGPECAKHLHVVDAGFCTQTDTSAPLLRS